MQRPHPIHPKTLTTAPPWRPLRHRAFHLAASKQRDAQGQPSAAARFADSARRRAANRARSARKLVSGCGIRDGIWTARFLARHIRRIWQPGAPWVPEFLASNATVDIARREADIGVRNRRPEQSWLAGRRTCRVHYAVYASDPRVTGYLALPEGHASTPSDRWVRAQHGDAIVTGASDSRLALGLALAGVGRLVMPTFAGDEIPGLVRLGAVLDEIGHDEWLVSHHDARHDPPIRAALEALAALLSDVTLRPLPGPGA